MKRRFSDIEVSDDKLNLLKNTIKSDPIVLLATELSKIDPRPLKRENVAQYIAQQKSMDRKKGEILEAIIASVQYVPAEKMFMEIKEQSDRFWNHLKHKNDKRFYILLTGSKLKNMDMAGYIHCTWKSNLFMGILALASNPNLLDNFVDFVCDSAPMHSKHTPNHADLFENVENFLYIDDASFSGTQLAENISKFNRGIRSRNPRVNLHVLILYMTGTAKGKYNTESRQFDSGKIHLFTTDTKPLSLNESLDIPDADLKGSTVRKFIRGEAGYPVKYLFYTDLKIADRVSIYSRFLLEPVLLGPSGKEYSFSLPLVEGCRLPSYSQFSDDIRMIDNGAFCPRPTYKTPSWRQYIQSFFN